MILQEEPIDIVPENVSFIAYNIGVYESVQKFGGLITSRKITCKRYHNCFSKPYESKSYW